MINDLIYAQNIAKDWYYFLSFGFKYVTQINSLSLKMEKLDPLSHFLCSG